MPRGVVALIAGLVLLSGHVLLFIAVFSNSSISPSSKNDIVALIIPLTVAAFTSAALYAARNAEIDLRKTKKVNSFFVTFAILVPVIFLGLLLYGIFNLDGEQSVKNFKGYMVAAEGFFGAVFAIMTEAVFSTSRTRQEAQEGENSDESNEGGTTPSGE